MSIQFKADNHSYTSTNPEEKINWISATGFIGLFKPKFDADTQAVKSSKNKKSKWYGMTPEEIKAAWDGENKRAVDLGSWYHDQREAELIMCNTLERDGLDLPIIQPLMNGEIKLAPDQNLVEGIYPEHMVYLKSAGLCGQADRVEVVGDRIDLYDYKTNKEIKLKGFTNWEGVTSKMHGPCAHLDDCNFNHYALQLSLYMYIMLKHNHGLKPGKMEIHHVIFEKEGENEHGYPITKLDDEGNPIVKEVVPYELPYLKKEIRNMIKWLRMNPDAIKSK
jgi:hypothetical protein